MNIPYLIQVVQNKITMLANARSQAYSTGDLDQLTVIEKELLDSQDTFAQLSMLASATQTATATNTSVSDLLATGINAAQNTVQGPSASATINGYDISAYATDALYEQKITNLLAAMPVFVTVEDIDAYIQYAAPGSPVTGSMILAAGELYLVDLPLLIAIMQNDSNFGTLGIGARTNNPGNVGNTGTSTQSYPSWDEGVAAVAEWLSRHRAVVTPVAESLVVPPEPAIILEPEVVVKKKKKKVVDDTVIDIPPADATSTTPEATTTPPVVDPALEASSTPPAEGEGTTTDTTL